MSQANRLLEKLGITGHDAAKENLLIAELIELNLAITIDNHLKLKKIMAQIDDLIAQAAAENAVIGQLATAVKSLADGYVALEDKYNALVLQGTEVTAITAEQFKTFGDDIATGKQQAQDALTSALNALNPPAAATPSETPSDPNPATGSGTDAGSTGSDSGAGSTDGSTPPADGSTPPTATDAVNG